ncbi:transposase [Siphonobacter sp. SORGH_AS_0500]|uniref:transposase n=1 Tax=Siphonobacter sp. SORGH_AS_0500 TaxID=1864824 RepID=UPI00285E409B|nr:transposase [Siphonobacter sp. SORGH_AS_0500]MDR6196918.1 hypothetical protein [Siphonobacter sp. SORGH_AS_0500]
MRMPKHHSISLESGDVIWINDLALGLGEACRFETCQVDGCWGWVWVKQLDEAEYLYLFGTVELALFGQLYRKRWCIEAFFQNLKQRGFHLESTYLGRLSKLSKLVALVSLAYDFCGSVDVCYAQKVQPIKLKKHGYKDNSFAHYGLNQLWALLRGEWQQTVLLWPLLQRIFGWLKA